MNNYSLMQKTLHRQFLNNKNIIDFCLNSIRERSKSIENNEGRHIFITGLARAGTTALLECIDSTNDFGSLRYKYMPFILFPKINEIYSRFIKKESYEKIERLHGDGIQIGSNSPECLDEVFWINKIYKKYNFKICLKPHSVSKRDLQDFNFLINQYLNIENKKRFIMKNNNLHLRIINQAKFYRNSFFLVIFRNPIAHSKSLLRIHKKFIQKQKEDPFILEYMNLIGHWEFGLNKKYFIYENYQKKILKSLDDNSLEYWINQWNFTYRWLLSILKNKKSNIKFICYEELVSNSNYRKNLFDYLDLKNTKINFNFKIGKSNNSSLKINLTEELLAESNYIYNELRKISLDL